MVIYIGADHRGFNLKETLKEFLNDSGYTVTDIGNSQLDPNDDYPDIAKTLAERISADRINGMGILICGSGAGMSMVANRFFGVRAATSFSPDHAMALKTEDDVNVFCIPADFVKPEDAKRMVSVWLQTPFSGEERYKRRIEKIREIDNSRNQ